MDNNTLEPGLSYSILGMDIATDEPVTLEQEQRLKGLYVIGKTGSGKTTLLVNLILQDIAAGRGLCFFDTHGDAITDILRRFPTNRSEEDVILLDLLDDDHAFGLNLFYCNDPTDRKEASRVTSAIIDIFAKLFTDTGDLFKEAPTMAETLQNLIPVFLAQRNPLVTLAELPLFLMDETARTNMLASVHNPIVTSFWNSYNRWKPDQKERLVESTRRRVGNFLADPLISHIIGQSETTIDFRRIMDEGKVLLVKLSREHPLITGLVGSMIVSQIANAAFSRGAITDPQQRRQFHLYADEYQRFATPTFAELLTEVRKYKIATCVAHQARGQLDYKNRVAALNADNLVAFAISGEDAQELAYQFDAKPRRKKQVLKQRTEPIYREWDEPVWDSQEAEQQYNKLIQEEEQQRNRVLIRAICAEAIDQHFRNAFRCNDLGAKDSDANFSIWKCHQSSLSDLVKRAEENENDARQITDYLHRPFYPFWLSADGEVTIPLYTDDDKLEKVASSLTLCDVKSETVNVLHDYNYHNKNGTMKVKRLNYSYLKRVEWYTLTGGAAISGFEHELRHGSLPRVITTSFPLWKGKRYESLKPFKEDIDALFRSLLNELIREVQLFITPYYEYEGIRCGTPGCRCRIGAFKLKFVPDLAPDTNELRHKIFELWELPPILDYPPLAEDPQPEVGQRRTYIRWIAHGQWTITYTFPKGQLESWLLTIEKRLEERTRQCEMEFDCYENKRDQQLEKLREFKDQHYKVVHHKDYLGEQPVKEQHTQIVGERWTRYRTEPVERITDVQWYDLVEEFDETPAQRRDAIVNELANPEQQFTAWCKLGTQEHIVRIEPFGEPDADAAWMARHNQIIEHTRQTYCQSRTHVEEEITTRQNRLMRKEPPKASTTSDEEEG